MTADYYNRAFGLTGREGLALMGAHTVGEFNPIWSRNNYGWVKDIQKSLFNNKYYKVLAQRSSKVGDTCTGTMADQTPTAQWTVIANVHTNIWKAPEIWASPQVGESVGRAMTRRR
jgi:hypothetical protein